MKADVSTTRYQEGNGTRYVRDELITYGTHDNCHPDVHTQHIGIRRYSLWVSEQFGDGALTRDDRFLDHEENDSHIVDRCTRVDISMWLPIVTAGV